jgi:hypothetical protein
MKQHRDSPSIRGFEKTIIEKAASLSPRRGLAKLAPWETRRQGGTRMIASDSLFRG